GPAEAPEAQDSLHRGRPRAADHPDPRPQREAEHDQADREPLPAGVLSEALLRLVTGEREPPGTVRPEYLDLVDAVGVDVERVLGEHDQVRLLPGRDRSDVLLDTEGEGAAHGVRAKRVLDADRLLRLERLLEPRAPCRRG